MVAFVVRAETDGQALLAKLRGGSARIGWSYRDDLDLTNIMSSDWHRLNGDQQDAWYCHGFIDVATAGDLIFYPNIPDYGLFCVVKLLDGYVFLPGQDGINGDFRSSRSCELITPDPIDKGDSIVPPSIRHKIGLQRRFYRLNVDQSDIDFLLRNLPNRSVAPTTHFSSFARMMNTANLELAKQWNRFFPVANLSRFLAALLERHGERVDLREGPSEKGSDLVVEIQNDFLDRTLTIGIQVGSYEGDVSPETVRQKLDQLLDGWEANSLDYGALVLTGNWQDQAKQVVEDHNRDHPTQRIKWIDGRELARIVTRTTWTDDT